MSAHSPKISVVMPVYNTKEEYLREAIESILNQTYSDFEFIILNDGSTNNVEEVVLSYKDERIKYFKNEENLGLPRTRNKLLDLANGEYIAYMDSDDISVPNRFEKQVRYMDENKDVGVLGAMIKYFPVVNKWTCKQNPKYIDIIQHCCIANGVAFLRNNKIKQYNLRYNAEFIISEDYEFWSRAIRNLKFANLEEILYNYRHHKTNVTKEKADMIKSYDKKIKQNMLDFLTNDKKLQEIILKYLADEKAPTFLERMFSVKRSSKINQYKIITILGFRFLVKI